MNALIEYLKIHFGIDNLTATTIVISLFTTLTVLIIGKLIDFIYREIIEFNTRKVYRKTLLDMIKDMSDSCMIQSTAFSLFCKQLNIEHIGNLKMVSGSIDLLNTFQKMSFNTFYGAYYKGFENFFSENNLKRIRKTFSNIEKLSNYENRLLIDIKEFNERYGKYQDLWADRIGKIVPFIEALLNVNLILPPGKSPDLFYLKIDEIFLEWQKTESNVYPYIVHNKLLSPLMSFLKMPENSIKIREVFPLFNDIREAILIFMNLKSIFSSYNDLFTHYETKYKEIGGFLKTTYEELK